MSQVRILSPRPRIQRHKSFDVSRWFQAKAFDDRITPVGLDKTAGVFTREYVAVRAGLSVASTPVGRPRRGEARPGGIILSPRPRVCRHEPFGVRPGAVRSQDSVCRGAGRARATGPTCLSQNGTCRNRPVVLCSSYLSNISFTSAQYRAWIHGRDGLTVAKIFDIVRPAR